MPKVSQLTTDASPEGSDLLYVVVDPAGTPLSRKATVAKTAEGGLSGSSLTDVGTPAATDRVLLQDASASGALKTADFSEFGGGGGGIDHLAMFAPVAAPHADDDEFDDDGLALATDFTAISPTGASSWVKGQHGVAATMTSAASAADVHCQVKPITAVATGDAIETQFSVLSFLILKTLVGLVLTDGTSTTSNMLGVVMEFNNTGDKQQYKIVQGTPTAYTTTTALAMYGSTFKFRIARTASTTWSVQYSIDGQVWVELSTVTSSTVWTHAGMLLSNDNGSTGGIGRWEYLRHTV